MSKKLEKKISYGTFIQCNIMGYFFKNEVDLCVKMRQGCQSILSERRKNVIHLKLPEWVSKMGNWLFGGNRTFDTLDGVFILTMSYY